MCELLALSSAHPARLTFSLHELAAHGLPDGPTHDGWGVGFHDGHDVALFREPSAAGGSPLVQHLQTQGPESRLVISHIRRATRGVVSLANTQPFVRELGGRMHLFAHNGDLPEVERALPLSPHGFRRVGQTDSEHAFCALLERVRALDDNGFTPSIDARREAIAGFAARLRTLGPANFLYTDGELLFAHGHRRIQRASGRIEAPGLWMLQRHCPADGVDREPCQGVSFDHRAQTVLLVASVPLSGAAWRPLAEGELLVVRDGEVLPQG